jgi:KaiC/GvpD/RAD55 family RecA-like ATPase
MLERRNHLTNQLPYDAHRHRRGIYDLWPGTINRVYKPHPDTTNPPKAWNALFTIICTEEFGPNFAKGKPPSPAFAAKIFWAWYRGKKDWYENDDEMRDEFELFWEKFLDANWPDWADDITTDAAGIISFDPDAPDDAAPVWLVDGIILAGQVFTIYGPPKSGKTFAALDLALSVATGRPWRSRAVKQGAVLYVIGEGNRAAFLARVRAWLANLPADERQAASAALKDNLKIRPEAVKLDDATARRPFVDGLQGFVLIVVDSVLRNLAGNVSDAASMSRFVEGVDEIRLQIGCTVLLVHHSGKDLSRGTLGSVALDAAVDGIALFTKRPNGRRVFAIERMRDGPEDLPAHVFTLQPIGDSAVLADVSPDDDARDKLLSAIAKSERQPTERALAEATGIPKTTLRRVKAGLVDDGLIYSDFRLTDHGRQYFERVDQD